jgi:hypothetical protein
MVHPVDYFRYAAELLKVRRTGQPLRDWQALDRARPELYIQTLSPSVRQVAQRMRSRPASSSYSPTCAWSIVSPLL